MPHTQTHKYGIVGLASSESLLNSSPINAIIEKPKPELAPSNMAAVGRYLLTPKIFMFLEELLLTIDQEELQLTDAISQLLTVEAVYASHLQGKRYDCGSKLGYSQATIAYALKHPEVGEEFKQFLEGIRG